MAEAKTETIRITLPDLWLVRHTNEFAKGKEDYLEKHPKAAGSVINFYGGLALWRAGFVKIEGPKAFVDLLNAPDADNIPMSVVGVINREIVAKLLMSQDDPLEWSVIGSANGSSGTS
jgi:hypothetical protein